MGPPEAPGPPLSESIPDPRAEERVPSPPLATPTFAAEVADALGLKAPSPFPCCSRGGPPGRPPTESREGEGPLLVSAYFLNSSDSANAGKHIHKLVALEESDQEAGSSPPEGFSGASSGGGGPPPSAPSEGPSLGSPGGPHVGVDASSLPSFTFGEGPSETDSWGRSPTQVLNPKP
ncbi:hypothetical protein Emag_007177 [Eimeria magna]